MLSEVEPNSEWVGMIIVIVTGLIVVLLVLIYWVNRERNRNRNRYKDVIKNYENVINSSLNAIDLFTKESDRLNKITECILAEIKKFKNSKYYKDYNSNGKQ